MNSVISSDAVMLAACILLTLATLTFVFYIEPDAADSAPHRSELDRLLERRDFIYDNLRDLKFERRAGKYAEHDYEQMKDALETEAAQVLLQIEAATGSEARPARPLIGGPARPLAGGPARRDPATPAASKT